MKIFYLPKFVREYKKLPPEIKNLAKQKEVIFRQDPFDARLKTHKLNGDMREHWSFSINYSYRIIFKIIDKNTIQFHRIGDHDIYN